MLNRSSFLVAEPNHNDVVFMFDGKYIYLIDGAVPTWQAISSSTNTDESLYCFATTAARRYLIINACCGFQCDNFQKVSLRGTWDLLSEDDFSLARLAWHIHHWRQTHRFCGICGKITQDKADEQALVCLQCKHVFYPRISPCIIVLIHDGQRILLARSPHFPAGVYSTVAGFVEPGESLEEALRREVMEEVGVYVKNIRYFGSQPWPFPDSLMIGFTAEYASGDIKVDEKEIEDAQWFSVDDLPVLPSKMSISRDLLDSYINAREVG